MDPPEAPTAISNLASRSMMTGVMEDNGRFPGSKKQY